MNRREFGITGAKAALAAFFAGGVGAATSSTANSAATALVRTAGIGISPNNDTLGEAIFWLNQAAVDNVRKIIDSNSVHPSREEWLIEKISQNPHISELLEKFTPRELWYAYKESPYSAQLSKTDLLSDDEVIKEISKVAKQAREYKKEKEDSATKTELVPSSIGTPNWARFEPMDYVQLRERSREIDGSGFYYR